MRMPTARGFSLLELLVCVAIIAVLAGIVFASTGPSRERARQIACSSNLHQIGMALSMYRNDFDGDDSPGLPSQMGFPPSPFTLISFRPHTLSSGNSGDALLHCPDRIPDAVTLGRHCDYNYQIWYPDLAIARLSFADA